MRKKYGCVFFSAEKRTFCLQRSVFFTTIVKFISLYENLVRTISASFGRSRSGKYREIRTTYSDFFANVFQWGFLRCVFLRIAVNRPLSVDSTWILITIELQLYHELFLYYCTMIIVGWSWTNVRCMHIEFMIYCCNY